MSRITQTKGIMPAATNVPPAMVLAVPNLAAIRDAKGVVTRADKAMVATRRPIMRSDTPRADKVSDKSGGSREMPMPTETIVAMAAPAPRVIP